MILFLLILTILVCKKENPLRQEWVARYLGPYFWAGSDWANAIAVDNNGNVYVTGQSQGPITMLDYIFYKTLKSRGLPSMGPEPHYDYVTIKYNQYGQEVWVSRYDGPGYGDDEAYAIAVDNKGNVYVTGTSENDYATIKYPQPGGN